MDGRWHSFGVAIGRAPSIDALRFCQMGRNFCASKQLNIGGFVLCEDVLGPAEIIRGNAWPADARALTERARMSVSSVRVTRLVEVRTQSAFLDADRETVARMTVEDASSVELSTIAVAEGM